MVSQKKYLKNKSLLADLSKEQLSQINDIEREAIARFGGTIGTLTSAIGFLRIGHEVGWRVLVITHHKATIKKYEEILDINIREFFPEEGPSAERSMGLNISKNLGKFWEIVRGQEKIENKRDLS